jgi:hypothetical protein
MLAAEGLGGTDEEFGGLGRRHPTAVVGGEHRIPARRAEAGHETADGARREVEGRGDGGGILAVLVPPPDGLAQGHGQRLRHGVNSQGTSERRPGQECTPTRRRGQTSCRDFAAKPHVA